jgi:predicted alpha-1,2-mannosidase
MASCAQALALEQPNKSVPLVEYVNILQGTDSGPHFSHGNTLPLVGLPWGMVDWSMQNGVTGWFFHPNGTINGFRATHEPSPWMGDWGQFALMPQAGDLQMDAHARTVDYNNATAVLHPDYEKLELNHGALTVELTGTERCGVFRFTFLQAKSGRLILDTFGGSDLKVDGRTIYGISHSNLGGVDKKTFASYFVVKLDRDITRHEIFASAESAPSPSLAPSAVARATPPMTNAPSANPLPPAPKQKKVLDGYVEFNTSARDPVVVKVGTSLISWQQAEQNLNAEADGSFDTVRDRVSATWNASLGNIEILADDDQKRTFYSCLYRAQMFPHRLYEIDATGRKIHYSPYDGKIHDGVLYGDIGIWDAFRSTFPFLALIYPRQLAEILQGFVNASAEGNGTLPEWPSPGYRRCMIGQHCAAIFADAAVKNIPDFDLPAAYESLRKSAFNPPAQGEMVRDDMADYLKLGYTPEPTRYSVSTTLDYAYDDWCVAQIARKLNHPDVADQLMTRAQNYRKLWDPAPGMATVNGSSRSTPSPGVMPMQKVVRGNPVGLCRMIRPVWRGSSAVVPHSRPSSINFSIFRPPTILGATKVKFTRCGRWLPSLLGNVLSTTSRRSISPISMQPLANLGRRNTGLAGPAPSCSIPGRRASAATRTTAPWPVGTS